MEDNKKKFIQIRLWKDCINNCHFCYLKSDYDRKTSLCQKKRRLHKSTDLVKSLQVAKIGLIGGEFFEGQLEGCEDEWFRLLDALKNSEACIFITANFIHEQYLLNETVDFFEKNLLLCTSYDTVGRFHSEKAKNNWFKRIESLHNNCVPVICHCVATQDFFEEDPHFPDWLPVNLVDPHISLEWYNSVDKNKYNETLRNECDFFNFPKRRTAIRWFRKHPQIARNYSDYIGSHSDVIYAFDKDDNFYFEQDGRLESTDYNNPLCSHPWLGLCYADSNKCMICDAKSVSDRF